MTMFENAWDEAAPDYGRWIPGSGPGSTIWPTAPSWNFEPIL